MARGGPSSVDKGDLLDPKIVNASVLASLVFVRNRELIIQTDDNESYITSPVISGLVASLVADGASPGQWSTTL